MAEPLGPNQRKIFDKMDSLPHAFTVAGNRSKPLQDPPQRADYDRKSGQPDNPGAKRVSRYLFAAPEWHRVFLPSSHAPI